MSFFDEADEPRRTTSARRGTSGGARRAPRRGGGGGGRRPGTGDPAVRRRQLILAAGGILVLILLVLGVKSCSDNARKQGLKEYNRAVGTIIRQSDAEVAGPLFQLLSGGSDGGQALELQNRVSQVRVEAEAQLGRAEDLDVPGEMVEAQRYLLLSLELRRDGVARIADLVQQAGGGSAARGQNAVEEIAGQMRAFDASDVVYSQRVIPLISRALQDDSIPVGGTGERIAQSSFLAGIEWLDPDFVAERLGSAAGGAAATGPLAPGSHGHGLISVGVGGTTLDPSVTNEIDASTNPIFLVTFQNQGENDERQVRLRVTVSGSGRPIVATKTVASTTAGAQDTQSVSLTRTPPSGEEVEVEVEVVPVRGEQTTDNNVLTFPATFSG